MGHGGLVEREEWEEYWNCFKLPAEVKKSDKNLYRNEILKVFDSFLPQDGDLSILEVGGGSGQYLAYMWRTFHFRIHALDYSDAACKVTRENFRLLGLEGTVYQRDLLSDSLSDLPLFDIVYSLGVIEHFQDLERVIGKHLELLRPGGTLVVGAPNFLGVNRWVLNRLDPRRLAQHNLSAMDIENWRHFEQRFNLNVVFQGYVGGFEPKILRCERRTLQNRLLHAAFRGIAVVTDNLGVLRRFNSKHWSGYVIGVFEKPE